VPITASDEYGGKVTETPEQPTNADLLAFMREGFAHVMTEISGVKSDLAATRDELRGEIRATEATLTSRIDAVQQVVRSVKADLAAHVNDPTAHQRHAA
jgi:hypothetical protein